MGGVSSPSSITAKKDGMPLLFVVLKLAPLQNLVRFSSLTSTAPKLLPLLGWLWKDLKATERGSHRSRSSLFTKRSLGPALYLPPAVAARQNLPGPNPFSNCLTVHTHRLLVPLPLQKPRGKTKVRETNKEAAFFGSPMLSMHG